MESRSTRYNARVTARDARGSNETLRKINLTRARDSRLRDARALSPSTHSLVVSASMYGTPLPNVNGVHRPCTLGRLVKCRPRRMGFDPRAPFSLANHAQCVATASAPRFFNPTVFSFPFAYDARTWGSHPRRISFVAEVVVKADPPLPPHLVVAQYHLRDERRGVKMPPTPSGKFTHTHTKPPRQMVTQQPF